MYKVFFNDREIEICHSHSITKNNVETAEGLQSADDVKRWFNLFIKSTARNAVILSLSPVEFWEKTFVPAFWMLEAAGGLVWRSNQLLLIFRNEKWDLPKGKRDEGETMEETALREVSEECGISGHVIVQPLPTTYHIYNLPHKNPEKQWILKKTSWFEMRYNGKDNGHPQITENITRIKWFDRNNLEEVLANTYSNLMPLLKTYLD
ncbi:MAG: hypothetical protein CSA36_03680 [Draconibacterium sp.]|nr:MAG: hypothetical protein CSA36_03680 [Draconibacterium sp.]